MSKRRSVPSRDREGVGLFAAPRVLLRAVTLRLLSNIAKTRSPMPTRVFLCLPTLRLAYPNTRQPHHRNGNYPTRQHKQHRVRFRRRRERAENAYRSGMATSIRVI